MPSPKRSASPRATFNTAVVDSLKVLDPERPIREADFVMVCRMRTDRERQAMAIDNRHDFHAFSAFGGSDIGAAAFRHNEGRVDEALFFIECTSVAKLVGDIR